MHDSRRPFPSDDLEVPTRMRPGWFRDAEAGRLFVNVRDQEGFRNDDAAGGFGAADGGFPERILFAKGRYCDTQRALGSC